MKKDVLDPFNNHHGDLFLGFDCELHIFVFRIQ